MYAGLGITDPYRTPRRLTPEEDAAARGERVAITAARVAAGELDPTVAPYAGQPVPASVVPVGAVAPGPYPVPQLLEAPPAPAGAGVLLPLALAAVAYFVI